MSRMVKFGLMAAIAMLVTVTASDVFAQCCNDDGGRLGFRGRRAARRAGGAYTNTCCAPQNNCCAPQTDCCNTAPACGCATVAPVNNCCNTCETNNCGCGVANNCGGCGGKGCCSRGFAGRRMARRSNYVSTGCCNTGCDTGCGGTTSGCPSCAQGVIQGSSEGSIVVPEASGQPVEPAVVPSDT